MSRKIVLLSLCLLVISCADDKSTSPPRQPEARSVFDDTPLYPIEFSAATRARLDSNLTVARLRYEQHPDDPDNIIWYGRRLAYLMRYREAIEVFSRGVDMFPDNYKLLRHRGHRYISIRDFDSAVADLQRAARLAEPHPDDIEPDGAPNKYNIPRSTTKSNIWYHLGLAWYLKGNYRKALESFEKALDFSKNDDTFCATADWIYMCSRRLGDEERAAAILEKVSPQMDILENDAYHARLLMYKGLKAADELLQPGTTDPIQLATFGYGVGNWFLANGDSTRAEQIFREIIRGPYWSAFGYIAAEADLQRMHSR